MNQIEQMFLLQMQLNDQTNGQVWIKGYTKENREISWYRGIYMEVAEAIDSFNWKHWKNINDEPDWDNIRVELVDIWHFGLSELIRSNRLDDQVGFALSEVDAAAEPDPDALRLAIEALAESSLRTRSFEMAPFIEAMSALSLSVTELFKLYVGKNVLNQFRQNNGYKDGSYRKIWQGREDNEHLVDLLARLDVAASEVPNALYRQLEAIYVR